MASELVRQNMIARGAEDLLDLLPAREEMEWRRYSIKEPNEVLVISQLDGHELLACRERSSAGHFVLRYCSQVSNETVYSWLTAGINSSAVEQDMVVGLPLMAPFKYCASTLPSATGLSSITVAIQWYFLGLQDDGVKFEVEPYCDDLYQVLQSIELAMRADHGRETLAPAACDYEGGNKTNSPIALYTPLQGWFTPGGSQSPHPDPRAVCTADRLLGVLCNEVPVELLRDLQKPDAVKFVQGGNWLQDALGSKLSIGYGKNSEQQIYAYIRGWGVHHRVELYVEEGQRRTLIETIDVEKHTIHHPFDKTYPAGCEKLDRESRERLSLLIKWNFVMSGVADSAVLGENSLERLRSMFKWIRDDTIHLELRNSAASPYETAKMTQSIFERVNHRVIKLRAYERRISQYNGTIRQAQVERAMLSRKLEEEYGLLSRIQKDLEMEDS